MLCRIRLLEYVRACLDATMGRIRICMGLHETRSATQCLQERSCSVPPGTEHTTTGLAGAGCWADQVGLGQLTCYAIGTTAQPALGGFPRPRSNHGTGFRGGHSPLDPPGHATPWGRGPEQRIGEPQDSERLEPADQAGQDPT